jgi:DNA uptake protein ComE-like DNA-binding protein
MKMNQQKYRKGLTTMNKGPRAFIALTAALALVMLAHQPMAWAAGTPAPAASAAMAHGAASAPGARKKSRRAPVKRIDINSASRKELKTLPGIGDAEADRIIAGRPYLSKAELANRSVLPVGPYLSIKNQIIALQKNPPKAKP